MTDALSPTQLEVATRAQGDLARGQVVGLGGPGGWTLAGAVETLADNRLAALLSRGAALALTAWRAQTLRLAPYDGDTVRIAIAPDTPAARLRAIADPARDMAMPLKGPFDVLRDGDPGPARAALALARGARVLPAVVLAPTDALPEGVTAIELPLPEAADPVHAVVAAPLPVAATPRARLHLFRTASGEEHAALEIGRPDRSAPVLARLHSACFTGDVLGSLKCDCGPQLHAALHAIGSAGGGILVYLNQEGRGIGLANKLRAYALQAEGFDTVEANHRLGFDDDERDFGVGAAILRAMGVRAVRLLTNNPRKVDRLAREGIAVAERVPLWVGRNPLNADYLDAKAEKSGHMR